MGQDFAKAHTPPPLSFRDCLIDGRIDLARYKLYSKRNYEDDYDHLNSFLYEKKRKRDTKPKSTNKKKRKQRSVKRHSILWRNDDGTMRNATSKDSSWYTLYIETPPSNERLKGMFRNRFRVPYNEFVELAESLKENELFSRWTKQDCTGTPPSDIRILLLGTLRYLGRGHTFDDVEESTFISREVHRIFFHHFVEYGSTILFSKYVTDAATTADMSKFERIFALAGFNGAVGSSDGTHIGMLSCPCWATNNNKGHKLAVPSRNFNTTVAHTRQILGTTCGHPGTWNDKTLILFDDLIRGVQDGKYLSENEFNLLELDEEGNEIEVTYKGAWFIVDNGYLNWSCTVPPLKNPTTYQEIRFSEWLESMRKDVECTFGILKGRFAILKNGVRTESVEMCDKIWMTCCALHNMLLFVDGLDDNWETGGKSFYEEDNDDEVMTPFAVDRLNRHEDENEEVNATETGSNEFGKYTVDGKRIVRKMPLKVFQERLIHHFDIRFKNKDIEWPKRLRTPTVV